MVVAELLVPSSIHPRAVKHFSLNPSQSGDKTSPFKKSNWPKSLKLSDLQTDHRRGTVEQQCNFDANYESMIALDLLSARAKFAQDLDASAIEISDRPLIDLIAARHLLLNKRKRDGQWRMTSTSRAIIAP